MSKNFYSNPPKKVLAAFHEKKSKDQWPSRITTWDGSGSSREIRKTQTWARSQMYQLYLASDEWAEKRAAVFERDGSQCVFCGDKARAVHHLSYDRIFNESLYDLISVCKGCHTAIHYDGK